MVALGHATTLPVTWSRYHHTRGEPRIHRCTLKQPLLICDLPFSVISVGQTLPCRQREHC